MRTEVEPKLFYTGKENKN